MAQVIHIGQPANDPEREAIGYLRDHLPGDYRVIHNFELRSDDGQWFEIDVAVVAPHAVYLVDVKSTYGEIHVAGGKWHPEGRPPFASPLAKLRQHTRQLHGVLSAAAAPPHAALRHVWVEAVVLLTAPDAVLRDPEGRDRDNTWKLAGCERSFTDASLLPQRTPPPAPTAPHLGHILSTLTGKARPQQGLPLLGRSWQCEERLTGNDFYTEYRARNAYASSPERVIVRVYRADPYLPAEERAAQRERIANAYQALTRLPPHPAIPAARDFFPTERDDAYVLVLNDAPGSSLRVHLTKPGLQLTMDQKLRVTRDLLSALVHCHASGVLHRAISPATVVVGRDGQTRLLDFDFARPGPPRERTLAHEIPEVVEPAYLAPELKDDALKSSAASDVYAAGATLYELFTGKPTFDKLDEALAATQVFPEKVSSLVGGLPGEFDAWLESLCRFTPTERPTAAAALSGFDALFAPPPALTSESEPEPPPPGTPLDYANLQPGVLLKSKYQVEAALGKGGFGRVYKVIDTFGDVTRALKIITVDRSSVAERMKQEYRTLANLPEHPGVVKVYDGDFLEGDRVPFLVMEFVEGANVGDLINDKKISVAEAHQMGIGVAEALGHLHRHRVTHGDIKPANLMWTSKAVRIVDFNVSMRAGDFFARGGGTRRYLPPDLDLEADQSEAERMDRDIYALGVTLYEAVTGEYPWPDEKTPPKDKQSRDPREITGFEDLAPGFAGVLAKAVAPRRAERFGSAAELAQALRALGSLRAPNPAKEQQISTQSVQALAPAGEQKPNTNPFVSYLLTLYSQSRRTNAGTRGLDAMGRLIYVPTALDRALQPATLNGEFRLILISGNAGDGKTAFIQQVESEARSRGAMVTPYGTGNGTRFELAGRQFQTNYDGSQDEGDKINDEVLRQFFAPFAGADTGAWPKNETRLIAINEGRLVDFLEQFGSAFLRLKQIVQRGLRTGTPEDGVAVVNLNLRSVVAAADGVPSILERLVKRLVEPKFWAPCRNCDLRDRCYVHHNAQTLANPTAGPQVLERLNLLYRLVTLRGRLHITLRDLRSALAFTIAGTRHCDEIHALYERGDREEIARGFYFNSWAGIGAEQRDRLLLLLSQVDVGRTSDPRLDRSFDFHPPDPAPMLLDFSPRGRYDRELMLAIYDALPKEVTTHANQKRFERHREYVAMLRRRHFFEARDDSWKNLIPYGAASKLLKLLTEKPDPQTAAKDIIRAINRGEGILDSRRLKGKLALQVRQVEAATVRSYRVFPAQGFQLLPQEPAQASPYLEHAPTAMLLHYSDDTDLQAELVLNLDVFEMLDRLNQGYRPTVDEMQGYYLSLTVFKNILGSAPYQEVLLTPTGHEFYSVTRYPEGHLAMRLSEEPTTYGA
ncbi:MAG: protein kinase [Verrucomicrobia bacterium]|jgi:serine/threonine protein kinase|nr:protein kinase [Verrucomicrobiota bacterium]OQC68112.1 MAG: Serine/threonine-protein kinase PknB [Verrucomicrobia bacterium ADurb.Bin006]NMD22362.1 protein kinase [Verrucomicrobiota bacterium]HOA62129.1 protein kinase [Verrucomicrobiota bacterium]HOF48696.1 protein kinase [Verrucomicrobiota bacterium]